MLLSLGTTVPENDLRSSPPARRLSSMRSAQLRREFDFVEDCEHARNHLGKFEKIHDMEEDYKIFLEKLLVEKKDGNDDEVVVVDDTDPEYKVFLENLREDDKSYVFEMKHLIIKYEEPEELLVVDKKKNKKKKKKEKKEKKEKDCLLNKFSDEAPRCLTKRDSDPMNPSLLLSKKKNPSLFLEEDYKHELGSSMVDDSYVTFLKMLRPDGTVLTMEADCGIVTYGEDNEISSDSEESEEDTPYPKAPKRKLDSSPKTFDSHTDDDDRDSVQSLTCLNTPCEYEDKLRKVLKMRYNEKELKEKYDEASTRKQLERHRDLRGRAVSYPTEQMSHSYLDYHPDLQHMVNMALRGSNAVRALSLLRCLFFYLENVSHEGGFIPWKRPSVLNMIRDLDNKL